MADTDGDDPMISDYRLIAALRHERRVWLRRELQTAEVRCVLLGLETAIKIAEKIRDTEGLHLDDYDGPVALSICMQTVKDALRLIEEKRYYFAKRRLRKLLRKQGGVYEILHDDRSSGDERKTAGSYQ